jgi:PAS domain S-box-containing protein
MEAFGAMYLLNQDLFSLCLPWNGQKDLEQMAIYPQETMLTNMKWPLEQKDLALINSNGDYVGWIPFPYLTECFYKLWQNTSAINNALLGTMDDAVTVVDQWGRVLLWNQSAEELYNCPKEEIIGKPLTDFFKEESIMLMATIEQKRGIQHMYNQSRPNIHVLVSTSPVIDEDHLIGGICVERNINDIVRLNRELSNQTAYIQDLELKIGTMEPGDPFHKIKGRSESLSDAIKLAKRVADTDASVLLVGQSGVGKELFAQAIHKASSRSDKPFVDLNCGAIPSALFESELFGYEKGAFTGAAKEGKKGKFDHAQGGTLFLDEIGELPLDLQVKLLRVLQEKKFYRVGGNKPIPFDVRIISATNRHLEDMIQQNHFRQDLYYRLNVVSIHIPDLRERIEDIPELTHLFIREFANKYRRPIPTLDHEVMYTFLQYSWPGNIRQLRNTIEHMIILADEDGIHTHHLPPGFAKEMNDPYFTIPQSIKTTSPAEVSNDREMIKEALETTYGNKSAAAKLLGVSRVTLYNKIKKYGLESSVRI